MIKKGLIVFLLLLVSSVYAILGDFDNNQCVGFDDFILFAQHYNEEVTSENGIFDLNGMEGLNL